MLNDSLYSSEKHDWETPIELFNALNNEFNFNLDVCASKENKKCENYFCEEDNALWKEWNGNCFMNPPYGRGIEWWVQKAYNESQKGNIIVCLLPVRSDTKWWHFYCMKSFEIRLLTRRLTFSKYNNKAPFPCAIVIFKPGIHTTILKSMES